MWQRYFSFFISLGILRSTWEFLEHNRNNSRKVEWQHWPAAEAAVTVGVTMENVMRNSVCDGWVNLL